MNRAVFNGTAINGNILLALIADAEIAFEAEGDILAATFQAELDGEAEIALQADAEVVVADTCQLEGATEIRISASSATICNGSFCFDAGVRIDGGAQIMGIARADLTVWTRILLEGVAGIGVELQAMPYGRPAIPTEYYPAHPEWSFTLERDDWSFTVPRDEWGRG